jgi:hypothetical protein
MAISQIIGASIADGTIAAIDITDGTITSSKLATTTGSGSVVLSTSPTITGNLTVSGTQTNSALTSGRITYASTGGLLTDSSALTFDGTTVTATKFAGALNGTVGATTPSTVVATSVTNSSLTAGRVTYANTSGLLTDSSNLQFDGTNLGLGVAPSAWGSIFKVTQIGSAYPAFVAGRTDSQSQIHIGANAYYDGTNWTYVNTGYASRYFQSDSSHVWQTAPSSSGTITFTSAMTLDASGYLGIGTTTPSSYGGLAVRKAATVSSVPVSASFSDSANSTFDIRHSPNIVNLNAQGSGITINTGNSTRMTITDAGLVGIGTTSPSYTLDVVGRARMGIAGSVPALTLVSGTNGSADVFVSNNTSGLRLVGGTVIGTDSQILLGGSASGTSTNIYFDGAVKTFRDTTGNVTQMVLDTSGNLGLGANPNAWRTTDRAIVIGSVGKGIVAPTSGNSVYLATNWYVSTAPANVYAANGLATRYSQSDGEHAWWSAPNNTSGAGAALSFSQSMTLTSSGYLGIGATSPSYYLEVRTNNVADQGIKVWGYSADGSKNSNIYFGDNNGTNSYVMRFVNTFGGGTGELYGLNLRSLNTSADFNVVAGTLASPIAGLTLKGNTGYVGLGTTVPYAPLTIGSGAGGGNVPSTSKLVFGTNNSVVTFLSANDSASVDGEIGAFNTVYNHQNSKIVFDKNAGNTGQLLFYTQGGSGITERMRITDTGSVGIGTTAPLNKLTVYKEGTSPIPTALFGGSMVVGVVGAEPSIGFSSNIVAATGTPGANQTAKGGIGFSFVNTSLPTEFILGIDGTPTVASNVRFYNQTERMRITSAGLVGIGTISPGEKLDVESVGSGGININNSAAGNECYLKFKSVGVLKTQLTSNYSDGKFYLYHGGVNAVTIGTTGNVGIGASPDVRFTVSGGSVGNTTGKAAFYTGGDENSISAARNEAIRIGRSDEVGSYYSSIWSASGSSATETTHWLKFYITNANGSSQTLACSMFGNGDVSVAGALSKGSGSFRIEHPLPTMTETHELVHSFIEGPQADLIYRGKVNLVEGKAVVNIDTASDMTEGTFVVLCRDVQCFTTNESDWTAVRGSVHGNLLTIEAQDQTCTASISWMVIGERQDKHMYDTEWTDDNGKVIVEPLKTDLAPKTVQI